MCKIKHMEKVIVITHLYQCFKVINTWMNIAYSIANKFHIFVFAERIVVGVVRSLILEGMHHLIYLAQPTLTE